MAQYLLRRLGSALLVLLALTAVTFALANLAPGDAARQTLEARGQQPTEATVARVRADMGLDESVPVRYALWLGRAVSGDLGVSYSNGSPVATELLQRLPATISLALAALALSFLLAIPLGIYAALRAGTWLDFLWRSLALGGAAVPPFWLGLLLIMGLGVWLRLLPTSGAGTPAHILLPALTLAVSQAALTTRLVRSGLLEVLPQGYIQAARAKGLSNLRVVLVHALPNALLPVITVLGLQLGSLLAGAAIVETIFAWPGVGKMAVDAIYARNYPLIQGFVLLAGSLVVVLNLITDICYGFLDPRVRVKGV